MFERFTEASRKVVVLAQEEAKGCHHNYIGTEHLLLGLIREKEGIAARVLKSLGVTLDGTRNTIADIVGFGEDNLATPAPFTPRAKRALELALREALDLHHNYVCTEHLLLALAREPDFVAARVLTLQIRRTALATSLQQIRREVIRHISGYYSPTSPIGLFQRLRIWLRIWLRIRIEHWRRERRRRRFSAAWAEGRKQTMREHSTPSFAEYLAKRQEEKRYAYQVRLTRREYTRQLS